MIDFGWNTFLSKSVWLFNQFRLVITWILHESEVFICKALKGEVVVIYFEPLITQQMKASGSPEG